MWARSEDKFNLQMRQIFLPTIRFVFTKEVSIWPLFIYLEVVRTYKSDLYCIHSYFISEHNRSNFVVTDFRPFCVKEKKKKKEGLDIK